MALTDDEEHQIKERLTAQMKAVGLWRDDVEPVWTREGDGLQCRFPSYLEVP